jgi:ATP-dependent DNA helicase RecG
VVSGPLTASEIASLIAGGEDSYTEFKSADVSPRDLAKELGAFLNADGGRVLIGVDDDGVVSGLGSWAEESVMNIARTSLHPAVIPRWQRVVMVGAPDIAVVSVDRGVEKPYGVGGGESRRYYIRVGSTSREATREELLRMAQASGMVQSDLRPVAGAVFEDLDPAELAMRFEGRRSVVWEGLDDDQRRRILVDAEILHAETRGPTIAGLLCYGRDPQRRLPEASIVCAAYRGAEISAELIDRADVGGRVDRQVHDAAAFVKRNTPNSSGVSGVERVDSPRPSIESIREILANAVAHRDYSIAGPVQVRVFADRLVVVSPGALPNGVSKDAMRIGVSVRRNPFVVQHLVERRVVDALGRGIVLVIEECLTRGLPEPLIETPPGFVEITLRW